VMLLRDFWVQENWRPVVSEDEILRTILAESPWKYVGGEIGLGYLDERGVLVEYDFEGYTRQPYHEKGFEGSYEWTVLPDKMKPLLCFLFFNNDYEECLYYQQVILTDFLQKGNRVKVWANGISQGEVSIAPT